MSSSDGLLIERRTSAAVSFVGLFFNSSPLRGEGGGTLSENKMTRRLTDWHASHKTKREVSPAGIYIFFYLWPTCKGMHCKAKLLPTVTPNTWPAFTLQNGGRHQSSGPDIVDHECERTSAVEEDSQHFPIVRFGRLDVQAKAHTAPGRRVGESECF